MQNLRQSIRCVKAKMKKLFEKCYHNSVIRYVFFGGLTTLVNLGTYYFLRGLFEIGVTAANIISVGAAILFAFFTNSKFVFDSQADSFQEHFREFVKFVSARLSTMIIEVGGVWFMADVLRINDYAGKFVIQFIVLALNYIFSKFLIFTKKKQE